MTDPVCPSCRSVLHVERLPNRVKDFARTLYCTRCVLVFSDLTDDPREAA